MGTYAASWLSIYHVYRRTMEYRDRTMEYAPRLRRHTRACPFCHGVKKSLPHPPPILSHPRSPAFIHSANPSKLCPCLIFQPIGPIKIPDKSCACLTMESEKGQGDSMESHDSPSIQISVLLTKHKTSSEHPSNYTFRPQTQFESTTTSACQMFAAPAYIFNNVAALPTTLFKRFI